MPLVHTVLTSLQAPTADCGHDKLVAFSCKRRGFCPSCGARRMAQTAAHLVDRVIPHVPVRQWVLSLPIPLRLLLAAQPKLVTPVLQVVHRVITRHLLGQAGLKADDADSGAVTLIQRFGSAANLNIHLHSSDERPSSPWHLRCFEIGPALGCERRDGEFHRLARAA